MKLNPRFKNSFLPLIVAVVVLIILTIVFYLEVLGLNALPFTKENLNTTINPVDVGIGMLIYLKTSIDFALFIGMLMKKYPGVKNRYAIEIGTGLGNMLGTALVLGLWTLFKEISILLGIMVLLASLVLFEMANASLEHLFESNHNEVSNDHVEVKNWQRRIARSIKLLISPILFFITPILSRIMPSMSQKPDTEPKSWWSLFFLSLSVPFILGLDDFAGYVPFFKVVNVFGFGIGVFVGHCLLNILLFLNPTLTIKAIKNPIVAILGALAFIFLGLYGLYEAIHIILETLH